MHKFIKAYKAHEAAARAAYRLTKSYCELPLPRVPGCDTVIRLAWRIECGRTIEEAAAREYLYRWNLAVKDFDQCEGRVRNPACSIFGTPHTLGM